jgi:CRISPR/Cas system CMR subunit Cmr6 (Cas7 group RAMP superfamily)
MEIEDYSGIMTLQAETHQGGDENLGAITSINQQDIIYDDERHQIPVISGNSIRGLSRRLIFSDLLDRLDLILKNMDVFHALFNGGNLSSSGTPRFDLKFRKKMMQIPPFHLFGFAIGNSMIQSNLKVKQAILCCKENKNRIRPEYQNLCHKPSHEYLNTAFFTRRDESKGDLVSYLDADPTESKAQSAAQMKVEEYVLIPGAKFQVGFSLVNPTALEKACLAHVIRLWQEYGIIGGKSQKGYGEMELEMEDLPDPDPYVQSIEENAEMYQEAFETLYAKVKDTKKDKRQRKKEA